MPKALLLLLVCAFGLLVYMLSTVVHETNKASPSRATKGDALVQDSLLSTGEAGANGKNKRHERIEKAKRIEELKHSIKLEKAYLAKTEHSHPLGMVVSTHFRCGTGVKRRLKNGALPFNID